MKEFRGAAATPVSAPQVDCLALLEDVTRYPSWHPDVVRAVEVLSPDEAEMPTAAMVTLRASLGPMKRDFQFQVKVTRQPPEVVRLDRLPNEPTDPERLSLIWRVSAEGESTRELAVELEALLDVPRLLPMHGAADAVARGFLSAACRALEDDSGS
jgi:hypothetical protein